MCSIIKADRRGVTWYIIGDLLTVERSMIFVDTVLLFLAQSDWSDR